MKKANLFSGKAEYNYLIPLIHTSSSPLLVSPERSKTFAKYRYVENTSLTPFNYSHNRQASKSAYENTHNVNGAY